MNKSKSGLRTFSFTLLGLGFLFAAFSPAEAKEKHTVAPAATHTETHAFGDQPTRLGFGIATYGGVPTLGNLLSPSLDAWYEIGSLHSFQVLATIASSDPFTFSVGAVYRYNLVGDHSAGAHAGLGFNMGLEGPTGPASSNTYFLNIFPVVGFHFGLGGLASNISLSFDGGPMFAVTPNFQFIVAPQSALLGASINYFF